MDFRKESDSELVDFTQNLIVQASNMTGTVIPPALLTTLTAQVGALTNAIDDGLASFTSAQAATQTKLINRKAVIDTLAQIKQTMRANKNPKPDFELTGFGALDFDATPITANAPTDLVATGDSTRQNYLRFKGNNRSGSVIYVIEYLAGDTMEFTFLAAIKSQKFTHSDVTPGQVYNYRVRAEAATNNSAWSNTAVVYGS